MKDPPMQNDDVAEELNEAGAIGVVVEDRFAFVATAGDVPDGAFVLEAKCSGHGGGKSERRKGVFRREAPVERV